MSLNSGAASASQSEKRDWLLLGRPDASARRRSSRLPGVLGGRPGKVALERKFVVFVRQTLRWFDADIAGMPMCGRVSMLSVSSIRKLDESDHELTGLPPNGIAGFVVLQLSCPPLYVCGTSAAQVDFWFTILSHVQQFARRPPLQGLGPVQAAAEKPILSGLLQVRDFSVQGADLDTFTQYMVSLFDSRLEYRQNDRLAHIHFFTVEFQVGDSRIKPNAFVLTDAAPVCPITYYFVADDWQSKRFWMQTMAKNLLNLKSMYEHASSVRNLKDSSASSSKAAKSANRDSDEDEDSDPEDERDKLRPPQVRRESLRRFYLEGVKPYEDLDLPKPRPRSTASSLRTMPAKAPSAEIVVATPIEKRLSNRSFASTRSMMRSGSTLWTLNPNEEEDYPSLGPDVPSDSRRTATESSLASILSEPPRKNLAAQLKQQGASGGLIVLPSVPTSERGRALAESAEPPPARVRESLAPSLAAQAAASDGFFPPAPGKERFWPGDDEMARLAHVASGIVNDQARDTVRITTRQLLPYYGGEQAEVARLLLKARSMGVAEFREDALREPTVPVIIRLRW